MAGMERDGLSGFGGAPAAQPGGGGPERKTQSKRLQADIKRKKQVRKIRKVLLQTLVEVEAKSRGVSVVRLHASDKHLHAVLERVARRIRSVGAKRSRNPGEEGALPCEVVTEGMMGAHSLGTLYVCV
mmetsp:Transcript_32248/g.79155  ORF Transcript_32248/g.79155 Transcript_32248/m.79155 type:complete len:128 (+) Transcript_32248:183-566(+)